MENGENAVSLEPQQQQPNVEEAPNVEEHLQTPTKSTHSSAAEDDGHCPMLDNKESEWKVEIR